MCAHALIAATGLTGYRACRADLAGLAHWPILPKGMPSILRTTGAPISRMKKGSTGGEGSAAAAAASRRSLRVGMLAATGGALAWDVASSLCRESCVLEKFGEAAWNARGRR